jgi:hypothetical protein
MKTLITVSLVLLYSFVHAQKPVSGIYLSSTDFELNKLAYADSSGKNHSIRLNTFFNKDYITIKDIESTVKLKKDSIYAFKNREGVSYRFYKREQYQILEEKKLIIYRVNYQGGKAEGFKIISKIYFSNSLDGEIFALTLDNVKKLFENSSKLDFALDGFFQNGNTVDTYDTMHKIYVINNFFANYKQDLNE